MQCKIKYLAKGHTTFADELTVTKGPELLDESDSDELTANYTMTNCLLIMRLT